MPEKGWTLMVSKKKKCGVIDCVMGSESEVWGEWKEEIL